MIGIPALSGAFMLVKRVAIDRTGGFDPQFFLYFEDFDWSVRLNRDHEDRVRAVGGDRPPRRRRGAQGLPPHLLVREERHPFLSAARLEVVLMRGARRMTRGSSSPAPTASSGAPCARTGGAGLRRCAASCARVDARRRRAPAVLPVGDLTPIDDRRAAERAARRARRRASRRRVPTDARDPADALRARSAPINVDVTERLARAAAAPAPRIRVREHGQGQRRGDAAGTRRFAKAIRRIRTTTTRASKWEAERALADVAGTPACA